MRNSVTQTERTCPYVCVLGFVFGLYLSGMWSTGSAEHHDENLWQQAEQNEQDDDQPGRHRAQHVGKNKVQALLPQERPASQRTPH